MFILALGHQASPPDFHIVSVENAFFSHRPQRDCGGCCVSSADLVSAQRLGPPMAPALIQVLKATKAAWASKRW